MRLGKVVGKLVATVKDEKIEGNTIRLVQLVDENGKEKNKYEVAADTVGAKAGDFVLTVKSSSARMTKVTHDKPIDNSIVAIVDVIECNGKVVYSVK